MKLELTNNQALLLIDTIEFAIEANQEKIKTQHLQEFDNKDIKSLNKISGKLKKWYKKNWITI